LNGKEGRDKPDPMAQIGESYGEGRQNSDPAHKMLSSKEGRVKSDPTTKVVGEGRVKSNPTAEVGGEGRGSSDPAQPVAV
jgi:hypothetical protein